MRFDNSTDKSKADAGAFTLGIEFIEQTEDDLMISGIYADPVVGNEENLLIPSIADANFDARCRLSAHVLDRVFDDVLENLCHSLGIAMNGRKVRVHCYLDFVAFDRPCQLCQDVPEKQLWVYQPGWILHPADARQGEQVIEQIGHLLGSVRYFSDVIMYISEVFYLQVM